MALNIRNNHTIELLCKMGPSTSEYSGWIHIKRNKVHIHSISVELRSGLVLHKQLMEGMTVRVRFSVCAYFFQVFNCERLGTLGWIRLPVLGEEKFTLHYSNPDDFQQSRSAGDLRPIEINSNQPAEFCVYGFEAGSFRRHIRPGSQKPPRFAQTGDPSSDFGSWNPVSDCVIFMEM